MDRFELGMGDPDLDERRHRMSHVKELFEVVERLAHLMRRWRHVPRVRQRGTRRSNPILGFSKLARTALCPSHALHQLLMYLSDEPERYGQLLQAFAAVVHRSHVVDDFGHVFRVSRLCCLRLEFEHIDQRCLGSLDLA
jgi:hypothetical protein